MRCAGCGFENPKGARFCNQCGGALAPIHCTPQHLAERTLAEQAAQRLRGGSGMSAPEDVIAVREVQPCCRYLMP